jgi:hypothetical protein
MFLGVGWGDYCADVGIVKDQGRVEWKWEFAIGRWDAWGRLAEGTQY